MCRIVVIALLGLAVVTPARGGSLLLGTGQDLSWTPSTQPSSPTFTVSVQNPGGSVTEQVLAWSLGLAITPEAGAAGVLSFATATQPSDYLFASDSSGISQSPPTSPVQLLANDIATDNGQVVPSSGANLLALTFLASAGAHGVFDIVAYGNSVSGSYWIPNSSTFPTTPFGNAPFASNDPTGFGSPVTLGTLTVIQPSSVPEPDSLVLLASGLLGAAGCVHLRRRRAVGQAAAEFKSG
jgi:PEP-CTERM motif